MATFIFTPHINKENDEKFNQLANQKMASGGLSPFKAGVIFKPNGYWDVVESEKGYCYPRIEGTISGITCYLWLSLLIKTGVEVFEKEVKEIKPEGLNAMAITANLQGMTCRQAAEWTLSKLQKKDGTYKSLKVKRIPFKTYRDGKIVTSSISQFDIID